jgi:predicted methyltransferase
MYPAMTNAEAAFDAATDKALDAALAADHRSEANKARDKYRHPKETLAFFGFRSDMTVVEIWPGGGWYTEILAPALKDKGTADARSRRAGPGQVPRNRRIGPFYAQVRKAR